MKKTLLAIAAVIGLTLTTLFGGVSTGPPSGGGGGATVYLSDFGAKHDGVIINFVNLTSNSAAIYTASANFTPADVGKLFVAWWGQASNMCLSTTIASVTDSNDIILTAPAMHTATSVPICYATDDSAAITNAFWYAATNFALQGGSVEIVATNGIYGFGAPMNDIGAGTHHNAQWWLPEFPDAGNLIDRIPVISFLGQPSVQGSDGDTNFWKASGTTILDTVAATNGSWIDCQNFTSPWGGSSGPIWPNSIALRFDGINLVTLPNTGIRRFNFEGACGLVMHDYYSGTGEAWQAAYKPQFTNSIGLIPPFSGNPAYTYLYRGEICDCYHGVSVTEHVNSWGTEIHDVINGLSALDGGGHENYFFALQLENTCCYEFALNTGAICWIHADIASENSWASYWSTQSNIVYNDHYNLLAGPLNYRYTSSTALNPSIGGSNIFLIREPVNFKPEGNYQPQFDAGIFAASFALSNVLSIYNAGGGYVHLTTFTTNNLLLQAGQYNNIRLLASDGSLKLANDNVVMDAVGDISIGSHSFSGNGSNITQTFNTAITASIAVLASGVTNTSNRYGTAAVTGTAVTYTNWDSAGNKVMTNVSVTGTLTWPLGPGSWITSATNGGLSGQLIFQ